MNAFPIPFQNPKRCTRIPVAAVAIFLLASVMLLGGCIFEVTALILSPGVSSIRITEGDTVHFQGSAIGGTPFLSEAGGDSDQYGLYWDVDGNELVEGTTADKEIDVLFPDPGTYTISLTALDKERNTDTASVQVIVDPLSEADLDPLEAVIVSPTLSQIRVATGQTVAFSGIGTGGLPFDEEEEAENTGLEPYGYFWDTQGRIPSEDIDPDGTGGLDFKEVDIVFNEPGVFTIGFTVRDSRGVVDSDSVQVVVSGAPAAGDGPLSAVIAAPGTNISINAGEQVAFSGRGIGGEPEYSFAWDIPGGNPRTSAEQSPGSVTFSTSGIYVVRLTVTDEVGVQAADTVTVSVGASALPTLTARITTPASDLTGIKSDQTAGGAGLGQAVSFSGTATGGAGGYSYSWDFPDGSPRTATTQTVGSVRFSTAGVTNTVTFTVTDSQGNTASDTVRITTN